jgi:hypothetical protein
LITYQSSTCFFYKKLSKRIDDLLSAHDVQCRTLQSDFNLKEDTILKKLEEANKQKD